MGRRFWSCRSFVDPGNSRCETCSTYWPYSVDTFMSCCRNRSALGLIEVIVVIAIMSTVMALTLPAVQKIRAACYRTTCTNNLRQIGEGLHNYHAQHGSFPPGFTIARNRRAYNLMSWHTRILPSVEQDALWMQTVAAYRDRWYPDLNPPHVGFSTIIPIYTCPSDGRTQAVAEFVPGRKVALTSYLGVQGENQGSRDGVLYLNSRVRVTDIADGSSNTIQVGERPPSADLRFGGWYADRGTTGDGTCGVILGSDTVQSWHITPTCTTPSAPFRPGNLNNQCDIYHFWSLHAEGANFLFADGTVRFLGYGAATIVPALATRNGGETAQPP